MSEFILASHNQKKIRELESILEPLGITVSTVQLPEVEETGTSFYENARLKAYSAMKNTGKPAIADDSGLCVDILNGAPGIYSSRYSGEGATDGKNNEKLLKMLQGVPTEQRTAHFSCCIVVMFPNGDELSGYGEVHGEILTEPQGKDGFGYDPLFAVRGVSMAIMSSEEKNEISHRGVALRQLAERLKEYYKKEEK